VLVTLVAAKENWFHEPFKTIKTERILFLSSPVVVLIIMLSNGLYTVTSLDLVPMSLSHCRVFEIRDEWNSSTKLVHS